MTATARTDIRPLSADETATVSGGFASLGMAIATSIALQQIPPTGPQPPRGGYGSNERYANKVRQFVKG